MEDHALDLRSLSRSLCSVLLILNQVCATSLINAWSIASNCTPLVGAFISDAIALGSVVSLLVFILTLVLSSSLK